MKIKHKRMRRAKKVRKNWTEYEVFPVTCECGRKYKLVFSICQPGKSTILDVPHLRLEVNE